MQVYFAARGQKLFLDEFIKQLQGKYLPYKHPDKDGKTLVVDQLQLGVRPIELYEVAFPAEHKDLVLNTILNGQKSETSQNFTTPKILDVAVKWIRRMMGLKEIPEYNKDLAMPVMREHLQIIGIGMKDDYWVDIKTGKYYDKKENEDCYEGI